MTVRKKKHNYINESVDMSTVGQVNVSWDFDSDDYQEYLEEEGLPSNSEILRQYVEDNVEFEVTYFDNITFHEFDREYIYFDDLISEFGTSMSEKIYKDCVKDGKYSFETYELYDDNIDINNPEQLNDTAMKLFQHGGYYKDARGFILTNGEVIYTPAEHNGVTLINGIDDKFQFIRLGNIRVLDQSIDLCKPPTDEQRTVLRKVIASYAEEKLYVDILSEKGGNATSAMYTNPDWRFVLADIDRYFREGIRLSDRNNIVESKEFDKPNIYFIGYPDDLELMIDGKMAARYKYDDSTAYPFMIHGNKLYIGDKRETHGQIRVRIKANDNMAYNQKKDYLNDIDGRIWVSAKVSEFNKAVVAFWGYASMGDFNSCKPFIKELCDKLKVNTNKVVVVISNPAWDGTMSDPIPFNEWGGDINKATEAEKQAKQLHMMSAKDKHDNTDQFRKNRDSLKGKKLTNDKGEEMPEAEYRSMIYQENKNITISEDQMDRIFKPRTNITITSEQYDRLFSCKNNA